MKELKLPNEPLAIMQDGYRDGWVYTVADLERQVLAAQRMGKVFEYEPTNHIVPHPIDPSHMCQVWCRI